MPRRASLVSFDLDELPEILADLERLPADTLSGPTRELIQLLKELPEHHAYMRNLVTHGTKEEQQAYLRKISETPVDPHGTAPIG
jgi:hypothetical protein